MADCKTCSKCGEVKTLADFHRFKHSKDGRKSRCKLCNTKAANDFAAANKPRATAVKMAWYWSQPAEYRKRTAKAWNAKRGAALPDSYIATCIARQDFSASIVPKHLINLKREQLSLLRLAKQLKQAITQGENA